MFVKRLQDLQSAYKEATSALMTTWLLKPTTSVIREQPYLEHRYIFVKNRLQIHLDHNEQDAQLRDTRRH